MVGVGAFFPAPVPVLALPFWKLTVDLLVSKDEDFWRHRVGLHTKRRR